MLVRIGDRAVSAPQLHANDALHELRLEERVQLLEPRSADGLGEVGGAQPRRQRGGGARYTAGDIVLRTALGLVADDPENADAREQERHRAVEREAQDEARRPRRGRGSDHDICYRSRKRLA